MTATTHDFAVRALEPFPTITEGDPLADVIADVLASSEQHLTAGDIVVVASKVVSLAERRKVEFSEVTPSEQARELAQATGKPAEAIQVILDESVDHRLATSTGPIIARHRLGYELTSAGVDRDREAACAWLLPADPDASARRLRDELTRATGIDDLAVVIADSDGRPDRRGATVLALGAAGIHPLRITEHRGQHQEETLVDMVAAAAGMVLGQRGRGAPVALISGVAFDRSDAGVAAMLRHELGRTALKHMPG
ncbi:coenzyme F420-0:L-glutamate ligase [Saccharopolyspora taberi]|uniref:coenzyme F420-0:L-glutamate ligase n=1 Tax=Saccharopolyspora taberi TaxID=60895 RepID=UPI0031D344E9